MQGVGSWKGGRGVGLRERAGGGGGVEAGQTGAAYMCVKWGATDNQLTARVPLSFPPTTARKSVGNGTNVSALQT